jgi:hypothetical protein
MNPVAPGGILSPSVGDELTSNEELVVQAIAGGSYFQHIFALTGTGDPKVFTIPYTPNPAASLEIWSVETGQRFTYNVSFTLSGTTVTFVDEPTGLTLKGSCTVSPV